MANGQDRPGEQQAGEPNTAQSPLPALSNEEKGGDEATDPQRGQAGGASDVPPNSRWQCFRDWVWPMEFSDAVMIFLTVAIAIGTIASAVAIGFQWYEMHTGGEDTHDLALAAVQQAKLAQLTSAAAYLQTGRTKDLAERMREQADQTRILATQARVQAKEAIIAADAARSAADTAKDALHISERAYIAVNSPEFDFASGNVFIALTNVGHIPSGAIEMKVFETNVANPDPSVSHEVLQVAERHWTGGHLGSMIFGVPTRYAISIPGVTADGVNSGKQVVRIGGIISYGDGFDGTQAQTERFCFQDVFDFKSKTVAFAICDPGEGLDNLIRAVGYPANEIRVPTLK